MDADKREESNGVGAIFIVYMFTAVMASDAFVHPKESGPGVSRHGGWTCSIFLDADKREESNGVGAIFIFGLFNMNRLLSTLVYYLQTQCWDVHHPQLIDTHIAKEVEHGRMLGPLPDHLFPLCHCDPIGQPGKWRLICVLRGCSGTEPG